ncbi:hypothetical protein DUNSADRAFT_13963 [Dunaliella salina]|uniref:Uncharacterized protein n=1 Tax=Dunaliella salina TaxID=3046 RepID=A0ABQ7G8B9_DUNSA|nr:hypothetical protein DUNSADRAFT_13963 [Dunaliella salina]KAF5830840.1 hypothetical protein DUNSADRAFT_13963 [Dunaliella salina]|eukprot:KAF5830839.1 hypothetical protein DUNSADRAFT_13963 [Dunaliella salina]
MRSYVQGQTAIGSTSNPSVQEDQTTCAATSLLDIPSAVLNQPQFDGQMRRALAMTSRPMRALVMRACTCVTVFFPQEPFNAPHNNRQLQVAVDHLRFCCSQGLHLRKLCFSGKKDSWGCYNPHLCVSDLGPLRALSPSAQINLQQLDISGAFGVTSLEPLAALSNLQVLVCEKVESGASSRSRRGVHLPPGDLSLRPLAQLTNLQHLSCSGMVQVTDLRPLALLPNLQHLKFEQRGVWGACDASPLASLASLRSLTFCVSRVSSLSPLSALTRLEHLDTSFMWRVTSLEPLSALIKLSYLDVSYIGNGSGGIGISSSSSSSSNSSSNSSSSSNRPHPCVSSWGLAPLAALTRLEALRCAGLQSKSSCSCPQPDSCCSKCSLILEPIAALTGLTSLDCSQMKVGDLQPLATLTNLRCLRIYGLKGPMACRPDSACPLFLEPVAALTGLTSLNCSYMTVGSLRPLAALTNLRHLSCYATRGVTSLEPLAMLTNLERLEQA